MGSLLDSPAVTEQSHPRCRVWASQQKSMRYSRGCFASENRLRQNVAVPHLGSQERSSVSFSAAREAAEGAEITHVTAQLF